MIASLGVRALMFALFVFVRGTEVKCPEGMYINGDCASTGQCEPCAACPLGKALSAKQQRFEARGAPTHSAADCVRCKPGQWSTAGSGECHACEAGRAVRACASCPLPKLGLCSACQAGKWSAVGAETCADCPGGRFSASKLCALGGIECCHRCPRGKHAPLGRGRACAACEPGTFASRRGQFFCHECAPGRYNSARGHRNCIACEAGRYARSAGSALCRVCPRGYYSTYALEIRACEACPAGQTTKQLPAWARRGATSSNACQKPPKPTIARPRPKSAALVTTLAPSSAPTLAPTPKWIIGADEPPPPWCNNVIVRRHGTGGLSAQWLPLLGRFRCLPGVYASGLPVYNLQSSDQLESGGNSGVDGGDEEAAAGAYLFYFKRFDSWVIGERIVDSSATSLVDDMSGGRFWLTLHRPHQHLAPWEDQTASPLVAGEGVPTPSEVGNAGAFFFSSSTTWHSYASRAIVHGIEAECHTTHAAQRIMAALHSAWHPPTPCPSPSRTASPTSRPTQFPTPLPTTTPTLAPTPAAPVRLTPVPTPATVVALVRAVVRLYGVSCEVIQPRFSAAVAEAVPGFFSANDVDVQACQEWKSNDPFSFRKQPGAMVNFTLSLSAVFCSAGGHFTSSMCASQVSARHLVEARAFSKVLSMNLGLHEGKSGQCPVRLVSASAKLLLVEKSRSFPKVRKTTTQPVARVPAAMTPTAKAVAVVHATRMHQKNGAIAQRHHLSRHQAQPVHAISSSDHRRSIASPRPVSMAILGIFTLAIFILVRQWLQRGKRLASSAQHISVNPHNVSASATGESNCLGSHEEKSRLLRQAESSESEDDPWLRGEHPREDGRSKAKTLESGQLAYELAYEYDDA